MSASRIFRSLALACVGVLITSLTACGSSDSDASGSSAASTDAVQIEHQYGTTEIEGVPERVVTLDQQWTDVMLAMGVEPVGYYADSLMPEGGPPWAEGERAGEALKVDDGVPVEQIAALEPDLIVGSWVIADEQTYDQLSSIAPTIAGEGGFGVPRWQELMTIAGDVLDEADKAKQVVDDVEAGIDQVAKELPGLKGKTYALANFVVADSSVTVVADENDGASTLFGELGMTMLPAVKEEGAKQDSPRVTVSTERVDLLASDFLAILVNGGEESDLDDIPGFDQLPASKSGALAVLDYGTVVGINTPTPLSIPYVLDQMRPYLKQV